MIEKTENIQKRFDELTELVSNPEIIADQKEWKKLMKERASLEELVSTRQELIELKNELNQIHKTL
jgi:peptide chain release factor 1